MSRRRQAEVSDVAEDIQTAESLESPTSVEYAEPVNGAAEATPPPRKKAVRESYYLVLSVRIDGMPDSVLTKVSTWRRAKSYIETNRNLLRRLGLNCVITRARNVETCVICS